MTMDVFKARVVRVVDGDTVELDFDLGFRISHRHVVRLADIDCPELRGPSRPAGSAARSFTDTWCKEHPIVMVLTEKADSPSDKYGRFVATLWPKSGNGRTLNDALVEAGHAVIAANPKKVGEQ
jgi:micrococcal nuclease